ncbi:MAG: TIGR03118 family protein [Bryobacteraceae bacterium]|jgi:uncharacterized protein (TIGR03118 family)
MKNTYKLSIVLLAAMGASAQDTATNSYTQTNLVSDISGMATFTDPHLINPWGLSRSASSFWWASDDGTGVSTLYNGAGAIQSLVVTVPPASGTGTGTPTGTVALGSEFIFVTLDGTISAWTSGTRAVVKVNNSGSGAVYTGCTTAKNGTVQTIYVANSAGRVEAYTTAFSRITLAAGAFEDPSIPAGYTPYGIQAIGTKIYVTFSAAPGAGGYVDVFNPAGTLLLSLAQGWFNQPWGIAQAPAGFGKFQKSVLVGNVGSGEIGAYNPTTGKFLGFLENAAAKPIKIPGLWALYFGGGNTNSGPASSLYFTAGIDNYLHGLFGTITAN